MHGRLMTAILCPDVPTATNMIASTDNRLFGTVVDYNCVSGHYVFPNTPSQYNSLSIECLESKEWNSTTIPACSRKCFAELTLKTHPVENRRRKSTPICYYQSNLLLHSNQQTTNNSQSHIYNSSVL